MELSKRKVKRKGKVERKERSLVQPAREEHQRGSRRYPDGSSSARNKDVFPSSRVSSSSTARTTTIYSTSFPRSSNAEKFVMHTSSEEEEFLHSSKKVTFASDTREGEVEGVKQSEKKHTTAFNFPVLDPKDRDIYFTVKGEKRRGLIVDPGAASGLVGSETLRDLVENCVKGKNFTIDKDKVVPVSGIMDLLKKLWARYLYL